MLKTKVKVGKVTNLSEARYCAGMGVDLLSFPISSVDPKTYQEITGWVAGPKFGIEASKSELQAIANYETDFVHVPGEVADFISDKKLIVAIDSNDWQAVKSKLTALKEALLFLEITVPSFDTSVQSIIRDACKDFNVLIKHDTWDDLDQILELPIAGISLDGSAEVKVGFKEYPLSEILEKLEVD